MTTPSVPPTRERSRRAGRWYGAALGAALLAIVLVSLSLGATLRWGVRAKRPVWNADEGISFLMISCQGGRYRELTSPGSPLYARWAPASSWQALVDPRGQPCLRTISHDLAYADVHPPAYFWLLHLWTIAFGNGLRASTGLNMSLFALSGWLLYRFARRVLASRLQAATTVAVFSMQPSAVAAGIELRPYALLACVTIAYAHAVASCSDPRRRPHLRDHAGLALATAAGMLTHHLFWFVIAGSIAQVLVRLGLRREALGRLLRGAAAVLCGLVLTTVVFPLFAQVLRKGGSRSLPADPAARLIAAGEHLAKFVSLPALSPLLIAAVTLLALGAYFAERRWASIPRVRSAPLAHGMHVLALLGATAAALAVQYAVGLSPPHAMSAKYLASVWPLAALVPAFAARLLGPARNPALIAICLVHLAYGAERAHATGVPALRTRKLEGATLVIDQLDRLHLPRLLPSLDPAANVFVASQKDLLLRRDWLEAHDTITYASCASTAGSSRRRKQLLERVRQTHRIVRSVAAGKCWRAYQLERL